MILLHDLMFSTERREAIIDTLFSYLSPKEPTVEVTKLKNS